MNIDTTNIEVNVKERSLVNTHYVEWVKTSRDQGIVFGPKEGLGSVNTIILYGVPKDFLKALRKKGIDFKEV